MPSSNAQTKGSPASLSVVKGFGDDTNPALREMVAQAMLDKGVVLGQLGRAEEDLANYAELLERFADDLAPGLRKVVAKALLYRGVTLGELGRVEEERASYAELVEHFGGDSDPTIRKSLRVPTNSSTRNLPPTPTNPSPALPHPFSLVTIRAGTPGPLAVREGRPGGSAGSGSVSFARREPAM